MSLDESIVREQLAEPETLFILGTSVEYVLQALKKNAFSKAPVPTNKDEQDQKVALYLNSRYHPLLFNGQASDTRWDRLTELASGKATEEAKRHYVLDQLAGFDKAKYKGKPNGRFDVDATIEGVSQASGVLVGLGISMYSTRTKYAKRGHGNLVTTRLPSNGIDTAHITSIVPLGEADQTRLLDYFAAQKTNP